MLRNTGTCYGRVSVLGPVGGQIQEMPTSGKGNGDDIGRSDGFMYTHLKTINQGCSLSQGVRCLDCKYDYCIKHEIAYGIAKEHID